MQDDLVVARPEGLYCPAGDFFIDPWRPVERAVITHAHADHARPGHAHYLAAAPAHAVLRARLGAIRLQALDYGERCTIGAVTISLHPAGHVLGSAQVRLEHAGRVWVVSGDYKLDPDPTCAAFEPVRCDVFITESTFGLPVFRWGPPAHVLGEIAAWWSANAASRRTSVLFCYAFGKAQRILGGIDAGLGPILCHGALARLNDAYAASGVSLAPWRHASEVGDRGTLERALVLAPPSAMGSAWLRRFSDPSGGFASGWMRVRGMRRRRALDRGFVLSDHADWPSLERAIAASEARRVIVTHGYTATMVRWLRERGLAADAFATEFGDEEGDALTEEGAAPAERDAP